MGLFFPSDPVIHGQRATGLPRYQELLERDWKSFLFADFVTLGLCIPYGLGVGYALLSSSLLVLIPVCVVGGLLVGPAISCMMDALFRSYRDAPRGWWENYCKGMKQNWKASLLPGVVFSLALGIELFFGMVLFSGERLPGIGTMAVFLAGLLILFMLFTAFWPQVVLFEESNLHRLQNAVLFCLKYGKHVLGAAVLQLVWWLLFVLFCRGRAFLCLSSVCGLSGSSASFCCTTISMPPMALKKRSASSSRSRHPTMMNDKESNHGHFNDW